MRDTLNCTLKFEDIIIIEIWLKEELVSDLHHRKIFKLLNISISLLAVLTLPVPISEPSLTESSFHVVHAL